jgi:4-hydroxy-tetrahydrodipicolinate synthase
VAEARKLEGVYPIVATTFADDGSLDCDSQRRLVEYLLEEGAHGLGLFGNASEGYALLESEREQLQALIIRQVNGRVPVIVSASHTGNYGAAIACRKAEDAGADALMVLPPYYLKPDVNGLFDYYADIDNAVSIPVMVQDAPLMTGVNMPASLFARFARELRNARYAKIEAPPTAPKVTDVVRAVAGSITVFGGLNGQFFLEEMERGARGTMPGSDMTRCYAIIWRHWEAGRRGDAWDLFTRVLPLMRFELQPGMGVSAMKHNLMEAGVIRSARVRQPTRALDDESLRELKWLRERVRCG